MIKPLISEKSSESSGMGKISHTLVNTLKAMDLASLQPRLPYVKALNPHQDFEPDPDPHQNNAYPQPWAQL
jgi:hypothetical protein